MKKICLFIVLILIVSRVNASARGEVFSEDDSDVVIPHNRCPHILSGLPKDVAYLVLKDLSYRDVCNMGCSLRAHRDLVVSFLGKPVGGLHKIIHYMKSIRKFRGISTLKYFARYSREVRNLVLTGKLSHENVLTFEHLVSQNILADFHKSNERADLRFMVKEFPCLWMPKYAKDMTIFFLGELDYLSPSIAFFPSLKTLHIKKTWLRSVPWSIVKLSHLEEIFFGEANLEQAPTWISEFPNLKCLYLDSIHLKRFPEKLCQLSGLEDIDLEYNLLTSFPEEVINLQNLRELQLSHNRLTSLPKNINQLTGLQWLSLNGNMLVDLPDMRALTNLRWISLYANPLSQRSRVLLQEMEANNPNLVVNYEVDYE